MNLHRLPRPVLAIAVITALGVGGYLTRETWLPWLRRDRAVELALGPGQADTPSEKVIVSDQAQKNLGLTARQLKAQTIWKTIAVPGMVVDWPGRSDRNVVAPVAGVVARVAHAPGDAVRPGEELFVVRLTSDTLQSSQTELYKAAQDLKIAQDTLKRTLAAAATLPERQILEARNQVKRLEVPRKAHRQDLAMRGLTTEQIEQVEEGRFLREIVVRVPGRSHTYPSPGSPGPLLEVEELKVQLGQKVQAGQALCLLANHQSLAVQGRAFRDETPLVERSARERWAVKVDFREDARAGWPGLKQSFRIRQLANTIDPVNRTFAFLIPLENQSRVVEDGDRTQILWRFRPGQRVRVLVDVERLDNVFVLPPDAVARDGLEAFVFTQNVNTFERKPVRVVVQERDRVVIDNDGSLPTYRKASPPRERGGEEKEVWTISAVAQTAAAQLNRMVMAGSGGVPRGYHVHTDGSLHKNHE
jgi:biotin carboxyl carrier protein